MEVSLIPITPNNGNKTRGNREVAAIGTASVIHQIATQLVAAIIATPSGERLSGLAKKSIEIKVNGPNKRPIPGRETVFIQEIKTKNRDFSRNIQYIILLKIRDLESRSLKEPFYRLLCFTVYEKPFICKSLSLSCQSHLLKSIEAAALEVFDKVVLLK